MAPSLLFPLEGIDFDHAVHDTAAIEAVNPHRGHMRLLDRIAWTNPEPYQVLAVKDVGHDEFWVPGHIPGRPIFPGVLMIEAAAQAASFMYLHRARAQGLATEESFLGFAGVDAVKFRGQVNPGDTFALLCQEINFKPRRCICQTQGVVNGNLVFEAKITGMPI